MKRLTQSDILWFQIVVFVPALYLIHSWFHSRGLDSLAQSMVYVIKLSYILILIDGLSRSGLKVFRRLGMFTGVALMFVLVSSSIMFPVYYDYISVFYYITDLIGIAVFAGYIAVMIHFFENHYDPIAQVFSLASGNTISMAIVTIIGFVMSGGGKVSTPPDSQSMMAIALGGAILRLQNWGFIRRVFIHLSVFTMIVISQLRMLMILGAGCYLVFGFYLAIKRRHLKALIEYFIICLVGISISALLFGNILLDRIETLPLIGDESKQVVDGIGDDSANQRSVEAEMVIRQMQRYPFSFITGFGFGAQYENQHIANAHYGDLQHHLHSTPIVLLFRNGLIGLLLYCILLLFAFNDLTKRNSVAFVYSAAIIVQWISGLLDLYIYWGYSTAFGIAAWKSFRQSNKTSGNTRKRVFNSWKHLKNKIKLIPYTL